MYRTTRDTFSWFDNDNKGTWRDKEIGFFVGPGSYQTSQTAANSSVHKSPSAAKTHSPSLEFVGVLTDKQRKISWNTGSVPFGSGSLRTLT
jgi:hypothetical protein